MKAAALAIAAGVAGAAPTAEQLTPAYSFQAWQADFGAVVAQHGYPASEAAFTANLKRIVAHNADSTQTFKMGVNQFTGMTPKEFKDWIGHGYSRAGPHMAEARRAASAAPLSVHAPAKALPDSLDWRTKPNSVTPVKDQGGCGGCWAFGATEVIESAVGIATGTLPILSPQEILACTPNPNHCGGSGGCNGATQELAFNTTVYEGITTEAIWPYTQRSGTCDASKVAQPKAKIKGYVALPTNNYTALLNAVQLGPVTVSAAAEAWMSYESGVFKSTCGSDIDHAIVMDGYGHDDSANLDYYLIRNSWGTGWGEKGYIRIVRYGEGKEPCFTDNTPGDGDGCSGGPDSIQVCGLCGILSDSSYPTGASLA